MSIVRWTPFREVEAMHNEMNRLFSRFGGFDGDPKSGSQWMLTVDVIETQDALKLKAALPGIDPQDVNIEVNDRTLTIMAERRQDETIEEGSYQWIEHQYGTFSRSVSLPRYADTEKIEAHYINGMMELIIPKKESSKPRRITLQTSNSESRVVEAGSPAKAIEEKTEPRQLQANQATS